MALQSNQFDPDLLEYCAFNFPAVTMTLGVDKWQLLEKAYNALTKDVQWKVRKTLAYSLNEISKILKKDTLIEKSLCPAFELFIRDLDEVKQGVIINLAGFLGSLPDQTREKYFKMIADLPEETDNWRLRNEIAKQLPLICVLASPNQIQEILLKLGFSLFNDSFATVRRTAFSSAGIIFKKLCDGAESGKSDTGKQEMIKYLQTLSKGNCFKRQMFIYACESIVETCDKKIFDQYFTPILSKLSQDKIPNVRLGLSNLVTIAQKSEFGDFQEDKEFNTIKNILEKDDDSDVKFFLKSKNEK